MNVVSEIIQRAGKPGLIWRSNNKNAIFGHLVSISVISGAGAVDLREWSFI